MMKKSSRSQGVDLRQRDHLSWACIKRRLARDVERAATIARAEPEPVPWTRGWVTPPWQGRNVVLSAAVVGAEVVDQPLGVVSGDEGAHGVADVLEGLEDADMGDLLLHSSEGALYDAVGLRLAGEGVARRHAPGRDLGLEISAMKQLP
jgi:hypothetical protein